MEKSEKSARDFFIETEDKASLEEMMECRDHVVKAVDPIIEVLRGGLNKELVGYQLKLTREELGEITSILMRAALGYYRYRSWKERA